MSKADLKISMKDDIFYATETEILRWAKKNRSELVKLKKDERFRREFIGNLAHELKTPIFSIQGYILTLLEGGLEDESVNRKFLNRALTGVERMNKIISDLDMITKFESEKIPLEFRNYDIVEICKEIFESLELKAKENKVRLSFAENYDRPIMVKCDKSRIGQVILNLVINAINYTSANCDIIIRFSAIDSNVLIEVEDNGPGISEKDLPRLFERFYRVDKSRARNIAGSGLGLSIVKHIIEAHGHRIQVRSTIDKGSTFFFTLSKV
jgi:two-component system phosphate regulon sensor histidine kinase PhoR